MPSKYQYYRDMMEQETPRLTEYSGKWTSFLDTAGRMYKYRFEDQVMIFLQKPDAQACAEYGIWNEVMHRYVLRGSKGIALIDNSGSAPKLRYVFDISSTGGGRNSRRPYLWKYDEALHDRAVGNALAQAFGIPNEYGLSDQTERIIVDLTENYVRDHSAEIHDIFDKSAPDRYDELRSQITFKQAVSISASYLVISRCGLDSSHILSEEFDPVRQFQTLEQVNFLGNAVSQLSELVLRQIERAIKSYEREHRAERSQNHGADLYQAGRLSSARTETPDTASTAPEQVREDAQDISSGTQAGAVQHADHAGGAVPPPVSGERAVGTDAGQPDDRPFGEESGPEPDDESHGLGEAHEQPESTGGGSDSEGDRLQLSSPPKMEQFSFFLTEDEQKRYIEQAEPTTAVSSAFTLPQENIDHFLLLGSNTDEARKIVALEYMKQKPVDEIAQTLKQVYHGGFGLKEDSGNISAWYDEDGIHLARGSTARYHSRAKVIPWVDVAQRIGDMLENGQYATNVELIEAPGYERQRVAENIWYFLGDVRSEAKEQGYLSVMQDVRKTGGFPAETEHLANLLTDQGFRNILRQELKEVLDANDADGNMMRFPNNHSRGANVLKRLEEMELPLREYHTDMMQMPLVRQFITNDEINADLTRGSDFSGGKARVFAYWQEKHTSAEKADFLKKEFGIGGHSHACSGATHSGQDHDAKGIRYTKDGCDTVQLSWTQVAARVDDLIRSNHFLTAEEKQQSQAIMDARNEVDAQLEYAKKLIDDYCQGEFGSAADFSDLTAIGIGHTTVTDEEIPIQAYANLENLRIERYLHETLIETRQYDSLEAFIHGELENLDFDDLTFATDEQIALFHADEDPAQLERRYLVVAYHHIENGFDEKLDYSTLEEAEKAAQSYVDGTMEPDHFRFDGAAVYDRQERKYLRIYGDYPDEKAHAQVAEYNFGANSAEVIVEPEQQEPDHFIHHFYVAEDIQKRGALDITEYSSFEDALRAYHELPTTQMKALGAMNTRTPLPGSLDFMHCKDGKDVIVQDYTKVDGWENPEVMAVIEQLQHSIETREVPPVPALNFQTEPLEEPDNRPMEELSDEEFAARYLIPGETTFDMDGRTFMVDRVTPNFSHVNFQDITFTNETGFPIFRTEPMNFVRRVFEQMEREQKAKEAQLPSPENFRITDDHLGEGGPKAKFKANIEAIRLLKDLEFAGRLATPDEQEILSRYVGWGGLADAFDASKDNWANEYEELQSLLTPEEYSDARASTLNAHYTSPTVIRALYDALEQLGFNGGNILEPAMGIGNFFGCLPETMADSRLYGVELDSISGRIAQKLYPKADITVAGFETTDRRDFYDLAVGNVPFGQYQVNDCAYNRLGFSIHNYFLAKAVDQVRPGGIVAFLTSRYTMDAKNTDARRYIAQRAELLGAVRLPNDAFKANAGTEVVSDILFFQKREHPIDIEPDWVHLDTTEDGFTMNSYFVEHPEMILGELARESTQYGREDLTVNPIEGADLGDQIRQATAHFTAVYQEAEIVVEDAPAMETIPALPGVRNYSYAVVDDEVYYRENSVMRKEAVNGVGKERIKGMVALRDTLQELIRLQMDDYPDAQIQAQQQKLNSAYDAFVETHGRINDRPNGKVFSSDSSYYLLCSLEDIDDEGVFRGKADIFTKRTIRPDRKVDRVDTATEALAVSIGERGKVDLPFMAQLLGTPGEYDSITESLQGIIFKDPMSGDDPESGWQTADEYLSGNVREKLRIAELSAQSNPQFAINAEYLRKAQPKDLDATEIDVRLGATWIPVRHIQDFMYETFQTGYWERRNIKVNYSQYTGEWQITGKTQPSAHDVAAYVTYGTDRANAYKILEETLNLKAVQIYDTVTDMDGKDKRVLNKKETTLAQQKQQAIKDAFADWIWKDPSRREELVTLYNERFNSVRPREYDGSHLNFVGMNPEITLRPHQINAIAHVIYGGNTLLAHEVGAGKSFEMIASAMESKRLGLCQKSMFVVPNHLTLQWANEFLRLYPSAKILVTSAKDFESSRRKKFCSRIATGDYDAVIIGHSQFERISISPERQERLLEQQLADIQAGIDELGRSRGDRFSIKQLEKTKRSIKTRLEKVQGMDRKDDVIYFEQLGIDRLFVDESQAYKNLFLYTKMRNIAGLSTSEAQRSSDMFNKCRYLDEVTGGRGVVFASGTPVSNSMTELYTLMRYLQYDTLQRTGLGHFDAWASTFGETTTAIELAPEGTGYRARTRFAKFFNLPELMTMFKEVADIKTADQLNLPVPEAKFETVVVQPSEFQKDMVANLSARAALVHAGSVDPSEDNMLKITSDGRKIGLDQRLMNPMLPDDPNSKLNACVNNVVRIYQEGMEGKLTQLIFSDMSTPKNDGSFNVYDDIKGKLLSAGIPESEIAFIHNADTEKKKKDLFGKVNEGKVRILLGSTQKMGAGTNVQQRLIALHHLDVGWRPSDMTQRNGRIIRQGNQNKQVQVYQYVTEGTFDAYLYQTLENKQKFIGQIMTSRSPVRSCDDVDEQALSYAEIKALCAGNPLIKEKMDLDIEVSRLKVLRSAHRSQQFHLEDQLLKVFPKEIQEAVERVEGFQTDLATAKTHPVPEDSFSGIELIGRQITDKEEAGKTILALCQTAGNGEPKPIGHYRGFDLELSFSSFQQAFVIHLHGAMRHQVVLGSDPRGNITRLDNGIANIEKQLHSAQEQLNNLRSQQEATKAQLGKPFPQEAEYQTKSKRLTELDTLLNMDSSSQEKPSVMAALQEPPPRKPKPASRNEREESL